MKRIALCMALSATALCGVANADTDTLDTLPPEGMAVKTLTIDVRGGGDYKAIVTRLDDTHMSIMTTRCNFKWLTRQEQEESKLTITGANGIALFSGEAKIANGRPSGLPTGSWTTLSVAYERANSGLGFMWSDLFMAPEVTINGRKSNVLNRIMQRAAQGAATVCTAS